MQRNMNRRAAMGVIASGLAAVAAPGTAQEGRKTVLKGRFKQAACRGAFGKLSLEELAREGAAMGLKGIDLLGPDEWDIPKQYGLTCSMAAGTGGIADGWNDPANHPTLMARLEELLPKAAASGLENMIVMSGNRKGMTDAEGLKNCAAGLKQMTPLAEKHGITLCMELLNSKRDHADYMCDRTPWGAELVQRVGSPRFKLLYDIYHMQIMEGDIIATIRENIEYIAHFHTAGVPGRHEPDETQELNYRRIAEAIAETGFEGYVAHEFIPLKDPLTSLRAAVALCDV